MPIPGSSFLPVSQKNISVPPPIITEFPKKAPIIKQKNTFTAISPVKNTEKTKMISISPPMENKLQENSLTANVGDSDTPINYKFIEITLAGFIVILLILKKFIKV